MARKMDPDVVLAESISKASEITSHHPAPGNLFSHFCLGQLPVSPGKWHWDSQNDSLRKVVMPLL